MPSAFSTGFLLRGGRRRNSPPGNTRSEGFTYSVASVLKRSRVECMAAPSLTTCDRRTALFIGACSYKAVLRGLHGGRIGIQFGLLIAVPVNRSNSA